jgi:hypothetical protein
MAKWLTISETSPPSASHQPEPPQVSSLITAQIDRDRTTAVRPPEAAADSHEPLVEVAQRGQVSLRAAERGECLSRSLRRCVTAQIGRIPSEMSASRRSPWAPGLAPNRSVHASCASADKTRSGRLTRPVFDLQLRIVGERAHEPIGKFSDWPEAGKGDTGGWYRPSVLVFVLVR